MAKHCQGLVRRVKPKEIVPGDVIEYQDGLAVVISNDYPATTIADHAQNYCEPGLVVIRHQRDDRWVRTHLFTYICLHVSHPVQTFNAVRVQEGYKRGPFLDETQRKDYYAELARVSPGQQGDCRIGTGEAASGDDLARSGVKDRDDG